MKLLTVLVSALTMFGGVVEALGGSARGSSSAHGSSAAAAVLALSVAGSSTCDSSGTLSTNLARDYAAFDRKERPNRFENEKAGKGGRDYKKRVYNALGFMPFLDDVNATLDYLNIGTCDPVVLTAAIPHYDACVPRKSPLPDHGCCIAGDAMVGPECVRAATLATKWAAAALAIETGIGLDIPAGGTDLILGSYERFCEVNGTCEAWEDLDPQARVEFLGTVASAKAEYAKGCTSDALAARAGALGLAILAAIFVAW